MAPIAGKYQLLSNDNLVEYFVKLGKLHHYFQKKVFFFNGIVGLPEEAAKKFNALSPGLEFVVQGNKYTIKTDSGVKNTATAFTLGEEFDDAMPTGDILKVIKYFKAHIVK